MKSQLEQNARSSAAKSVAEGAIAVQARPGIVAIGKVGSFRKLDPGVRPEFYKNRMHEQQKNGTQTLRP